MGRLSGKVAIVTGGAQGMGSAHARIFATNGAKVILTDVKVREGKATAKAIGRDALFIEHDVSNAADWQRVVCEGEKMFGPISILVNNAGIVGVVSRTIELSEADYHRVCAVNQTSVFLGMRAVLPTMIAHGGGAIVNISSIAGMLACTGSPNLAYVGSKFAIRGMTKHVAVEYAANNIRVNSIHPGFVKTPMNEDALDKAGYEAVNAIPMGRFGEPHEVAELALFLASDEASFITGTEHVIDGGMIAG